MGRHSAEVLVRLFYSDRDPRYIDVTAWDERDGEGEFYLPLSHPATDFLTAATLDDYELRMFIASASSGVEWHLYQAAKGIALPDDPYGPRNWVRFRVLEHYKYLRSRMAPDEWVRNLYGVE
ncbi:hypothetical protein PBI_ABCAT_82 [Mycobacterium phage ABCat]|nr:hypothetical protein PBI_ABCAT_82 [Mycobacterium phage ABCat]QGJ94068.1 hypothetical protein SEA_COMMAND613_87 [Mycobacterium phage Command613]